MDEVQSWEEFVNALEQMRWQPANEVEGGTIYSPADALEDVLGDDEWYNSDWYYEEPAEGIERHTLLAMNWESHGAPISWSGFLEMLQAGDEAAYVLLTLEGMMDAPELLAKVVPAQTPAAYRTLFHEIARNGETFLPLPDHISNGRPDLLDQATVRESFWRALQGDSQADYRWSELRKRMDEDETDTQPLTDTEKHALLDRYFKEHYEEAEDE